MRRIFYISIFTVVSFLSIPITINAKDLSVKTGGEQKNLLEGLGATVGEAGLGNKDVVKNHPASVSKIIGQIIQIILSALGVVFLVLMVYGGYLWMTGGGKDEQIAKAKNIMATAVVGLFIVLAAYMITNTFVINLAEKTGIK